MIIGSDNQLVAKVISFGIQKGGSSKTTTCGITATLLSEQGYRVLAVDFDSQGNLTQLLTQRDPYDFTGNTIFDACVNLDVHPCIHSIRENLDIIPAEDFLSKFARHIYEKYIPELRLNKKIQHYSGYLLLKETLKPIMNDYDFVILDLPPNLGEQTLNGIATSDYCVVMLQTEPFCFNALDRYMETLSAIQKDISSDVKLAGILVSITDQRRLMDQSILKRVKDDYEDFVFNTIVRRRARIMEFAYDGISHESKADKDALEPYTEFVKELLIRVQN